MRASDAVSASNAAKASAAAGARPTRRRDRQPVIAIDGPAAAGKSTTARGVARRLGLLYIDTGAMYRALALKVVRLGIDPGEEERVAALLPATVVTLEHRGAGDAGDAGAAADSGGGRGSGGIAVLLDGADVTGDIRSEAVGAAASTIARYRAVRVFLVAQQRELARAGGIVMEGRDIGTVVLPGADLKVYLVASEEVRSRRRRQELAARGVDLGLDEVRRMIEERDRRDRGRAESPLKPAADAVTIDTTGLTIDGQIEAVIVEVERRLSAGASDAADGPRTPPAR